MNLSSYHDSRSEPKCSAPLNSPSPVKVSSCGVIEMIMKVSVDLFGIISCFLFNYIPAVAVKFLNSSQFVGYPKAKNKKCLASKNVKCHAWIAIGNDVLLWDFYVPNKRSGQNTVNILSTRPKFMVMSKFYMCYLNCIERTLLFPRNRRFLV